MVSSKVYIMGRLLHFGDVNHLTEHCLHTLLAVFSVLSAAVVKVKSFITQFTNKVPHVLHYT